MDLSVEGAPVSTPVPMDRARRQQGLSLVELMVALLIGLVLLAGVFQIYLSGRQSAHAQEDLARMQENGRYAMDLITQDLRRAGYWGGNADATQITGLPGRVAPDGTCTTNDDWVRMVERRVFGVNDAATGYGCAGSYLRGDILAMRHSAFDPADETALDANRIYLRSSLFSGRIMRGNNANIGDNEIVQFAADEPVVRELLANAYYVGNTTTGVTCARTGGAVPVLRRVRVGPTGVPMNEELVPGVEHLQVRYLVAGNVQYVDANTVTLNDDWADVSAVRVWLLMRSECPEPGLNNATTYVMGDIEYPDAADDFRRQLYVATVMLRNWTN
jgi:type IV pilus assembly protein PilW